MISFKKQLIKKDYKKYLRSLNKNSINKKLILSLS